MKRAQLVVRDLHPDVVKRLRARAVAHGRSAEAEHRAILEQALLPKRSLKETLLAMPDVGSDSDFERPRRRSRRVVL
jgi:plasmid stability protein